MSCSRGYILQNAGARIGPALGAWLGAASGGVLCVGGAAAQEPAGSDKSRYTLLRPTPPALRRPLRADRPDATESPYTVDTGAVQVELSFVEHTLDRDDGEEVRDTTVLPVNLKFGLTNTMDVQLLLPAYQRVEDDAGPDPDGMADMGARLKVNLWGNDEGRWAVALLPSVVLPTGDDDLSTDHVEWALAVPFAMELGAGWGLGAQVQVAFIRDGTGGYDTELSHTVTVGHGITERLGAYIEYIGSGVLDEGGRYSPSLSGGATYALSDDWQLDAGVVVGLDDPRTDDVKIFAGMTVRF